MKSKVILFSVVLFCSKIVDSIPHSENHVRQRVNPLSNWQVNKKVPNAQYLDTDFMQPRNVNKLTNSAIQQENDEDYYSNQRGYNYDGYGYNNGPASPSANELLVNYDSPADGRRLDSYPPRVESYPSHTSQVGHRQFDHQQYRNQKRSQNPFTDSVPSSVFIPNDERPLASVQEPYGGLAQYVQPEYVPSFNRPFYQPGRSYLTREQLQFPSVDHSGVNKYVVNSATRFGSIGQIPYENYSESQASETKSRPIGVRRHVQNFETPSEINYETHAVESPDTLVDQSENIRYSVPYENYREGQVSETKIRPTGVRRQVQNFETPSEINYETSSAESSDTLVDQSENIRYPVPSENYREGQVSETKTRLNGVHRHVQNFEIPSKVNYENPSEVNYETPSEVNYETLAVESSDTLVDQSENIRYPVPHENYREGQVSETKTRPTGVRRYVQNFETPSEINYETPAVEYPDTFVDQSENIRYPVPYENYREAQVSKTKTRLTGVRRHVQNFKTPSEVNYETPAVVSSDTLVDQSENRRYSVPYENYREGQVSETKTRLTGVRRQVQDFETPSEINYETPAVESPDVENSRSGSHLSNFAPITSHDDGTPVISETDNYSSDSSNLAPVVNVNKETTVEISKILADKPLARKYARTRKRNIARDNSNNEAPTDITETVEVKEGKYGTNYAEDKAVPINTNPEDSLTLTNTVLENSGSLTYEESNVPQYGSSRPKNAIHHLSSEIKELSLKSLVANPEIQHILSRTDKRYVVVHSNGTIEYLDTLPLDSQQDSKLHLVHTKRKNIDGSESDGVLTPQWRQNLPSNIAKTPAPVDESQWPTNNQPTNEYDSNRIIPFKNLPTGHSHLKRLLPHAEEPADNDSSKPLLPPVNQSDDEGYSKPLIPNEDQPVDDENQPRADDSLKPLLTNQTDANHSKDKINLTPYARNPVHVKRHKHAYVTLPANDNTFKSLLPNEAQPREDRNPADDINSEPLNENLSGDDIVPKLLHPYYRHLKKSKHSRVNVPADGNNSNPSTTPEPLDYPDNQPGDDNPAKPLSTNENQSVDNKKSKPSETNENQTGDDYDSEPLPSNEDDKQTEDGTSDKPQKLNENQSEGDIDSKPLSPHKKPRAHHNKAKPKHSHVNLELDDDNSNPLSQHENQPGVDNAAEPLPSNKDDKQPGDDKSDKSQKLNENQSEGDIDTEPLSSHKKPRAHHNKAKPKQTKQSHVNLEIDDDNSNPSSQHENQPGDETDSTPSSPHKKPRAHHKKPKHSDMNQPADDDNSKLLPSPVNKPVEDNNPNSPKPSYGSGPADDSNSKKPSSDENQPEDNKKSKSSKPLTGNQPADDKTPKQSADETKSSPSPQKKQRAHRNKSQSKHSRANQPANDSTSKPQTSNENDISPDKQPENVDSLKPSLSPENRLADDNDSKPLPLNKKRLAHRNKSKHSNVNKPPNDNNSNPASPEKNQLAENNGPKPLPSTADQPGDETDSTPSLSHKKQRTHHKKPKHSDVNKSVDDNNSKTSPDETQTKDKKSKSLLTSESQSTNDNNSKPSPPEENQPEDDIKSKPTPVSSKNDDESRSTTLSPTVPSDTTTHKPQAIKKSKRKHGHRKTPTTPVVSTTRSPDDASEDQIITLSPIEQVTDNVSDVPTLTTTTAKPVETPDKQDSYKDAKNKPNEANDDTKSSSEDQASISDKVQTSTTTETPSSSTSPIDNASDDKTKGKSKENKKKAVVSKENKGKDNTQKAVYNSSELLDTNTDVPEETDDYSNVTPSPSVQNDVYTGDASGDNSSELEQSETDLTITVSSSTTYDSEDEIFTINIDVSESTDNADSPSNDKTLVVSIDTNPDNDDDDDSKALQTDVSKSTKTEDCKDDHNDDDDEIDLSNLKGAPTMWIKTSNQDVINKLTAKNDTQIDVIYFFSIENQPTIEREKETTIFCNGTVVIETTETTYAHKDDPSPTIVKTTEIMQIEDYELYK